MQSQSKTVLITGCSEGGIGSALAVAFQKRNFHVFATARNVSKMEHLRDLPNMTFLKLDTTSDADVAAAAHAVQSQTGGKLDYLVNNAGQTVIRPTLDFDIEHIKSMFDNNIFGAIRVTQAFAPMVIAARGCIINISSISTACHTPWMGVYAGSKAAVQQFSETLAMELKPLGVRVVTVQTGAISTNTLSWGPTFTLPENSYYKPIEEMIKKRAMGQDGAPRTKPEDFAEMVVDDAVDRRVEGTIWKGSMAWVNRWVAWLLPGLVDYGASYGTGLNEMAKWWKEKKER